MVFVIANVDLLKAQAINEGIRIQVEESEVYVYHTLRVPPGSGFNIYRSQHGGDFVKLNSEPVLSARDVNEFLGIIGEMGEPLRKNLELNTTQDLYFRLNASRLAANLTTFYYPEVAQALGHLFIDTTAELGSAATYKIELIDENNNLTGDVIQTEVNLSEITAPQPSELKAEHKGREIILNWKYPTSDIRSDDKIVRFNVFNHTNNQPVQLNDEPIIRINNFDTFEYVFTAPRAGMTLNLQVVPISLTGSEKSPSEILQYVLIDNEPPAIIAGLEASANRSGKIELIWPVSTDFDAAGYNIYRAREIKGNFKKINEELIPLLNNYYVDTPDRPHGTYFYRITAVDDSGNESEMSNAAHADPEDHTPPLAPLSFSVEALKDGTARLNWQEAERKYNFKSYLLFRKRISGQTGKSEAQLNTDDVRTNTFIDLGEAGEGLTEGAYYEYKIIAMDSLRNFSDTLSAVIQVPDLTPPVPPSDLIVENKDGVYTALRWGASLSTDVGEYLIYKGASPDAMQFYESVSVKRHQFRDDSVAVAQTYYYSVTAKDTLGNESLLPEPVQIFVRDFTPPRAVRNVRAEAENNQIHIRWEPVEVYDLVGYKIYYSESYSGVYKLLTEELITETNYTTSGIALNSWIKVRAVDTSGNESKDSEPAGIYVAEKAGN